MLIFLALSDSTAVSMWVTNLVISVVMGVALYRVAASARRAEKLEESRDLSVQTLRKELHDTTSKLVDERFTAMTHRVNGHVQGLVSAVDELKARLHDGDGNLRVLGERDHALELQLLKQLSELKTHMIEKTASKDDLREHERTMQVKVEKINEKLVETNQRLAVITRKVQ